MQPALLSPPDSRREARYKVLLRARMRSGATLSDVCIRDISSRGLLLQAPKPPTPGVMIELRTDSHYMVGRVRWAGARRFGISITPSMDVDDVLGSLTQVHQSRAQMYGAPAGDSTDESAADFRQPNVAASAAPHMRVAASLLLPLVCALWLGTLMHEEGGVDERLLEVCSGRVDPGGCGSR